MFEVYVISNGSAANMSFWFSIFEYANSTEFRNDRNLLPSAMQGHTGCIILLQILVVIFKDWVEKAINNVFFKLQDQEISTMTTQNELGTTDANQEVNGFLGWAVKEVLDFVEEAR